MAAGTHAEEVDRGIHRHFGYKDLLVPCGDFQLAVPVVARRQSREALLNVEKQAQARSDIWYVAGAAPVGRLPDAADWAESRTSLTTGHRVSAAGKER
jgi:hypothetical protein